MRFSFKEKRASEERSKTFMALLGLFGAGVFAVFAWIGFTAPNRIPGRSYYYLWVRATDADNVTPHNQVRVDGDIEGQVLNPVVNHATPGAAPTGEFEMQLDPSVAPLRADTTVVVLPRSAVGVRYVEVTPGLSGRKLPSGSVLSATQESATNPLDTALSTFDPQTRANTQKFLRALGEGLFGEGQNINDALGGAPSMLAASGAGNVPLNGGAPAMLRSSGGVLSTIAAHRGYTADLVRGGGTLAAANYPVRVQQASGFQPEADALKPFDDTSGVDGTLSQAPPTLTAASSQLPAVDQMAGALTGFATALTPGLQAAPAAMKQTSALLVDARPELVDAKSVLRTVGSAVNPTVDLLQTTRPVLNPLKSTLSAADPILGNLGAHGCDIVDFGKNWTNGMQYGDTDGGGNFLRFDVVKFVLYGTKTVSQVPNDPYPAPCVADGE